MLEDSPRFACDARFPAQRILRLIRERIAHYHLDLSGLTVLTEAASGYYRVTPVIAALAGANQVLALARDTRFGTVAEVQTQTRYLAEQADVASRIRVTDERSPTLFAQAGVVTNLGGVRPINAQAIAWLKPTAVVSLMFGGNDWRAHELDLVACWYRGIAVAGVDEEAIELFRYTGMRIVWFLMELGIEIVGCRMVAVGQGAVFGKVIAFLSRLGAEVAAVTPEKTGRVSLYGGRKVAEQLTEPAAREAIRQADALLTFDPSRQRPFIGDSPQADITSEELAALAPAISVVNYSGQVDRAGLQRVGINCFPRHDPGGGHSANTIGELLPAPVIELHTAGLKVGELMARARLAGHSRREAEEAAIAAGWGEDLRPWAEKRGVISPRGD